jgi:hypothetical protein
LLRPHGWHWSMKFSITLAASVLLLLLTYHAFVRFTFIGATLNGRRHPRRVARWPGPSKPVPQSSESSQDPSDAVGQGATAVSNAEQAM